MNFLKSAFIATYMMLLMAVTGFAGWLLYRGASPLAWTGVLLTSAPLLMVIGWLMMFRSFARTSERFPMINLLGIVGVGMAGWAWYQQLEAALAPTLAVATWLGFLAYAYWYSRFGRTPSARISAGSTLPNFAVKTANGGVLHSREFAGRPAILIFYRGNWCPLCMAQVKELVGRYQDLKALGVRVALISPQPHSNTIGLAKKFGVDFDFLTDEGNGAARALGIDIPHGIPMGMQMLGYDSETVMPTVIITDAGGKIVWVHETDNYRVRPEPDVFLDALRRHRVLAAA